MKSWFEQLTVVRNFCAHHGRIWNATFTPASTTAFRWIPELAQLPKGQSERMFGTLRMMAYLLSSVSPGGSWPTRVDSMIEDAFAQMPHRHVAEMGFPADQRVQPMPDARRMA